MFERISKIFAQQPLARADAARNRFPVSRSSRSGNIQQRTPLHISVQFSLVEALARAAA